MGAVMLGVTSLAAALMFGVVHRETASGRAEAPV
jgi:hypothetical protein